METRVAVMGIIVEDTNAVNLLNEILHEYSEYIIGRMGIPYRQKESILSVLRLMRHRIPSVPFPERLDVSVA